MAGRTAETVRRMPPVGVYLAREAGQLAGVSGDRIGQWARRGYIRASQTVHGGRNLYSFQDVAEAMLVHELIERGVDFGDIRRTVEELRDEYGDWPLQSANLHLATHTGKLVLPQDELLLETGNPKMSGTYRHDLGDLVAIVGALRRGGWAARNLPDLRYVEVDPDRLSGAPVIRGKRVPVDVVIELAAIDGGRVSLRRDYGVTDEEIDDALRWHRAVVTYEAA